MSSPVPVLLRPDNFTPPTRTPWGGTRLSRSYKAPYVARDIVIGESWEISVEPDFPGALEDGRALTAYLGSAPHAILGDEAARGRTGTALLVKLIDTDGPLSVQIHPSDDYAGLAADECGKPESWYIVDREPGAGLYLGFQRGVSRAQIEQALREGGSLEPLLRFVPVEPGDFFLIDAGTPHAIGPGLTLVEPQHVIPGRRGVTYRYWDWNRRYDARGVEDASGEPRALHVEHALAVTRWRAVQEDGFVESIRVRAPLLSAGPAQLTVLAGDGGLASEWLHVARLTGTGRCRLPALDRLQGLTVLAGTVEVGGLRVEAGRSAVVPAQLQGSEVTLHGAHAIVSAVA
ncbi:MAG TPA: type I phosphomannose isomerase catalytic subunit [Polyangiales bacterium]|nr:type I phosphomannose isomerase catalytic subunit [Polyangiales bacterium]